jgi:hypothetical protein
MVKIRVKFNLPPKVLGVFQFEPQSLKLAVYPLKFSQSSNLNLPLKYSVKMDGN